VNESNAIDAEELLCRKVSVNSGWYNLEGKKLSPDALRPRSDDTEGISLDRANSPSHPEFRSMEQAAKGRSANGYYLAIFRVGDLRSQGFTVEADSLEGNPGHALLKDLTYGNCKEPQSREKMALLAHKLVIRVEGPFKSESSDQK